ncbi:MAG: hypothetical protein LBI96_07055 [Odoribacteraceae bacterium]|jgi:hypothetical protein|nr:hypothetical protein [Odoribacteraceae bacterium]
MITKENYEQHALDYLDDTLDAATRADFDAFARLHPEVAAELEGLEEARLHPRPVAYGGKGRLYRRAPRRRWWVATGTAAAALLAWALIPRGEAEPAGEVVERTRLAAAAGIVWQAERPVHRDVAPVAVHRDAAPATRAVGRPAGALSSRPTEPPVAAMDAPEGLLAAVVGEGLPARLSPRPLPPAPAAAPGRESAVLALSAELLLDNGVVSAAITLLELGSEIAGEARRRLASSWTRIKNNLPL